ncbi:transcriptional regulator [Clostridium carboxidivorans P7]|uniref:LytR/AlgR family response regulator transcription factor n=1 Tax=Clostridium carboxidivorans TaxID=217159 RepID=UPI0001D392B6|nr:LytTR family DNA-binding domain-containing protein [Clostridium carboxidivorans]AKN33049.1 transcriptional regulator [Clostridium carboxidivorans P7]EFG88028.1 response regulator receiver domain protein [Clostridium carboxidivorans P7]
MLKIAICEDEINQRQGIVSITKKYLSLARKQHEIVEFSNGEELMISALDFDIYFLDILMNKITGIDAAKKIRCINEKAIIIFISGIKDYVFEAFDVRAFNYILKPVNEEKFKKVLYSALESVDKSDKFIIAKTISQKTKIFLKDIMYIESEKRKLKIHTTYDIIEYYYKLYDIEQELSGDDFFRCHKSYIVNLNYVYSYDNTFITLKNLEKIYVSKYKLNDFSKAFMYYLKNEGQ